MAMQNPQPGNPPPMGVFGSQTQQYQFPQLEADPLNQRRLPMLDKFSRMLSQAARPDFSFYNSMKKSGRPNMGRSFAAGKVDDSPIWTDQQINRRVNETRANIGAQTQNSVNDVYKNLGGRGFATRNSPLAMLLENQSRGMGLMNQNRADNDIRWTSAEGNKKHVLEAQTVNVGSRNQTNALNAQVQSDYSRAMSEYQGQLANAWNSAKFGNSPLVSFYLQSIVGLFGTQPNYTQTSNAAYDVAKRNQSPSSYTYNPYS